jgi:hypothetical protein
LNDGDLLKTVEYVSEKKFKIRFKKIKNSFWKNVLQYDYHMIIIIEFPINISCRNLFYICGTRDV